jgi:RNA polymerase sigma-70 factor (ECF subfamily)
MPWPFSCLQPPLWRQAEKPLITGHFKPAAVKSGMEQHQESEIADGLREGQTEAWHRLYDAHAEQVWRLVARAMEPGCADVGDVVQETLLAAAKSARQFDPSRGSLGSWLSGIARRQVALYYRRQQRSSNHPTLRVVGLAEEQENDTVAPPSSRDPNPVDAMARAELAQCIRSILTQLPTEYELLLVAKYIDGATIEEIAVSENASQEAIRSKLARARRAFRRLFERTSCGAVNAPERRHHGS